MSTAEEPISAFGAFQATQAKKKSKKSTRDVRNGKKPANGPTAITKKTKANVSVQSTVGKTKSKSPKAGKVSSQKPEPQKTNKANGISKKVAANKNKQGKIKDSEVVDLVEELMGDPSKKLSKAEQKKKQHLEEYLVKELEKYNEGAGSGTDFDSEESGDNSDESDSEEYASDSNEFSAEYTINESSSFTEEYSDEEDASGETENSSIGDNNSSTINKSHRKRRSSEKDEMSAAIITNGIPDTKKQKKQDGSKNKSRKSLPVAPTATEKIPTDETKRRKSLASIGEKTKQSNISFRKASITTANIKLEPLSPPHNVTKINSIDEGKRSFQWLINPVSVDDFFSKYWEAKACLIKRKQSNYFSQLISFEAIDQMLIKNHVEFTKNLDVTSYKNGIRETLNPEGRALPPVVWDHYGQGCSIRLLNPQTFLTPLYSLNTTLQEYFHCLVGANAYLTPPNSQGFAPHYDDIEAFVLQIEGRKRWKLYKPRSSSEILPRDSSHNFTQREIGKPILEEVLEPGDVLYFPRGTIHQACTEPGYHSLHITLSVYQRQSYADLFEKMLPLMLQKAISSNVDMRRGLPLHTWQHTGIAYSDISTKERSDLQKKVTQLLHKCIKDMPLKDILDAAVDQVAKKFQHEALPPEVLPSEKVRTVFGSRSRTNERGECVCDYDIDERTNVRLLRANILRLVDEEEKIRIYYYLDNSKEYCEYEPNFIEIEPMEAASVEVLIKSYPAYIGVSQLPLPSDEQKINLVTALWERGLLMMEKPFR